MRISPSLPVMLCALPAAAAFQNVPGRSSGSSSTQLHGKTADAFKFFLTGSKPKPSLEELQATTTASTTPAEVQSVVDVPPPVVDVPPPVVPPPPVVVAEVPPPPVVVAEVPPPPPPIVVESLPPVPEQTMDAVVAAATAPPAADAASYTYVSPTTVASMQKLMVSAQKIADSLPKSKEGASSIMQNTYSSLQDSLVAMSSSLPTPPDMAGRPLVDEPNTAPLFWEYVSQLVTSENPKIQESVFNLGSFYRGTLATSWGQLREASLDTNVKVARVFDVIDQEGLRPLVFGAALLLLVPSLASASSSTPSDSALQNEISNLKKQKKDRDSSLKEMKAEVAELKKAGGKSNASMEKQIELLEEEKVLLRAQVDQLTDAVSTMKESLALLYEERMSSSAEPLPIDVEELLGSQPNGVNGAAKVNGEQELAVAPNGAAEIAPNGAAEPEKIAPNGAAEIAPNGAAKPEKIAPNGAAKAAKPATKAMMASKSKAAVKKAKSSTKTTAKAATKVKGSAKKTKAPAAKKKTMTKAPKGAKGEPGEQAPSRKVGDLSQLKPSTLSRRAKDELENYLIAEGVSIFDEKGKPLKKQEMVQLVLGLSKKDALVEA